MLPMKKTALSLSALLLALTLGACQEANNAVDETQKQANDAASKAGDAADDAMKDAEKAGKDWSKELDRSFNEVNWDKYPDKWRKQVEEFAAKDNCNGINGMLDRIDEGKQNDLTRLLKKVAAESGCA